MRSVTELVAELHAAGVQLWHNRGRLYCGPLGRVSAEARALLTTHKEQVIAFLKRHPPQPEFPVDLIAPQSPAAGSYRGSLVRAPWDYEISVILPHLNCRDLLEAAVACWRHQTVSPYLVVIDTGTLPEELCAVEAMRSYDLELHTIAAQGWRHSSSPVAAACDLAFAVCQTRYALLTHVDVFPRSYQLLEELLPRCTPSCPVVGYQMSRRMGSEEWKQCPSHTLTLVDLQAMRRARITWNLLTALEADDEVEARYLGWPDTETQFGRSLRAAGIVPEYLGPESNASMYETELIVHWRSLPSIRQYAPEQLGRRYPGLAFWLALTREQGKAAPLPPRPDARQVGG